MTNEEYVRSMDDCTRERIEKQKMKFKIAFQEIAEMN